MSDGSADYRYVAPGAEDKLIDYFAVMIDQPEIFIAPDSAYKGVKPRQLDALADALRAGIASALSRNLYIVEQPGENVMYMRVAITNLKLKRKKKVCSAIRWSDSLRVPQEGRQRQISRRKQNCKVWCLRRKFLTATLASAWLL